MREPPLPPTGPTRLEIEHSLPRWIVDELVAAAPAAELAAIAAAFAEAPPLIARVNLLLTTVDDPGDELREAGDTDSAAPLASAYDLVVCTFTRAKGPDQIAKLIARIPRCGWSASTGRGRPPRIRSTSPGSTARQSDPPAVP